MNILINGLGIAGPTLAWWLLRYGHKPVLVEQAPQVRHDGFVIDFWGPGYDVARKMRLLEELKAHAYPVDEVRMVDSDGHRKGGFPASSLIKATRGRYLSLSRSDLSRTLFYAIDGRVEVIFGDKMKSMKDDHEGVSVSFRHAPTRHFDCVIGADGIHSLTRALAFGPEDSFERYLGYMFAAFILPDYQAEDPGVYLTHNEPGRQIARFTLRGEKTLVLMVFAEQNPRPIPDNPQEQCSMLRDRFSTTGWETRRILNMLDQAEYIYMDRVSQIRMEHWHNRRIALVGDAAFAPSLLAGQGSSLAMLAAYVLAGEIARAKGNCLTAFTRYESKLHDYMLKKQQAAARFATSFAPKTKWGVITRDWISKAMRFPGFANWAMGELIRDNFELKDYSPPSSFPDHSTPNTYHS